MKYLHTAVRVPDLEKALDFYCGTLGFREVNRFEGHQRPCTIVFLAAPGDEQAQLEVVCYWREADRKAHAGFSHVAYQVEDIYETCQQLMDRGCTLALPPRDGFMAFVRAPDGLSIELLQQGGRQPAREPWQSMPDGGTW
jgi:lactoylglutathione lyase